MQVLFQNQDLIVVFKPAGWLSVPARDALKTPAPVLSHVLRDYSLNTGLILPVHRLDRSTSGVMVFACHPDAQRTLSHAFEKHLIRKEYRFFASGSVPSAPSIVCNDPILEKTARTAFRILKRGDHFFYGSAEPRTGRFHQIRIHARNLGFPLLGDKKYGGISAAGTGSAGGIVQAAFPLSADRTMLHAYKLVIPDVGTFVADEPEDFMILHAALGNKVSDSAGGFERE